MAKVHPGIAAVWDRKKWQTERDGKKVKKGAVKGVSMGDLLDKYHKAAGKGIVDGMPAAKKLLEGLTKYKKEVKKDHKDLHDRIERQLEYNVKEYLKDATLILNAAKLYKTVLKEAKDVMKDAHAEYTTWESGDQATPYKSKFDKAAKEKLENLYKVVGKLEYYSDKFTDTWVKQVSGAFRGVDGAGITHGNLQPVLKVLANAPPV